MEIVMMSLVCVLLYLSLIFFSDDSCLPYKRKLEKMLDTIMLYQRRNELSCVEIDYKGKHFKVDVDYDKLNFYYSSYEIRINGNIVKTFHVLEHLFSKSRQEQHHGNMRHSEEDEIINAVYKYVKKKNNEHFDKKWDESSYFN